jgi:hypothetical protein
MISRSQRLPHKVYGSARISLAAADSSVSWRKWGLAMAAWFLASSALFDTLIGDTDGVYDPAN